MPTFDFIPKPVQMPDAVRGVADDSALRIQQQGRQAISQGVNQLASAYQNYTKEQDEADMVATRSAVLRVRADEEAELAGLSNKDDIKKVQEKYKTKYDGIIGGNEPLNGKPYFRNQSGKDAFNKGFMENFNTQRYTSGKKLETQLDRRDTHAKYMNGIKSVIDQPNWNTPQAHAETSAYVDSMIEAGIYTPEEGKAFKEISHTNLDIERANKMFAGIETTDYNEGELEEFANMYKDQVNGLKYIDEKQKADYIKKADQLVKNRKASEKVRQNEIKATQRKLELDYDGKMTEQILRGNVPLSEAIDDDQLSQNYRNTLLKQYNEQKSKTAENELQAQQSLLSQNSKMVIDRAVYNYDPANDRLNNYKQRSALQIAVIEHPSLSAQEKSNYQKILMEGLPMDEQSQMELKSMDEQLTNELGIGVTLDKEGKLSKLLQSRGFEPEMREIEWARDKPTGDVVKDGLNTNKRMKIYTTKMGRVRELFKRGKVDEARLAFTETITALQKFDNDVAYFDAMRQEQFVRTGTK